MPHFCKTTIVVEVLSEGPYVFEGGVEQLAMDIGTGDCVGTSLVQSSETLSGKQMADALHAAGSTPDFFRLDDDGNSTDDGA